MLDTVQDTLIGKVDRWLADFERATSGLEAAALDTLFIADCNWRDLLAFTWHIETLSGIMNIRAGLEAFAENAQARGFVTDSDRTPPRSITRVGVEVIEAIFKFETAHGPANGVVRLTQEGAGDQPLKAWTLMTALDQIAGFEEAVGDARPTGEAYSRDFGGPNWLDNRTARAAYTDRDPAVLVVGGGHAGLSAAARLTQLGVDTLIVDRETRIGDNWRKRYHALTLHNQVHVNHLPYMPFPPNWPKYIPKDKLANWFENYADSMDLNFWTETEFRGGSYDAAAEEWSVELRMADGTTRTMRPRHVVMATSVSSTPNIPDIPTLETFSGPLLHSSQFTDGAEWADKKVLVIGTGNSAHDIAQDLHSHGAAVTMVQRSPTLIVGIEPSAQLPYAMYSEGPPLEDNDLLTVSFPFEMLKTFHQRITEQTKVHDKSLLDGLTRAGFKLDFGTDNTGWQFKYLERGGGYYFNVGCSDLIIDGRVGLIQFDEIETFLSDGPRLKSGEVLAVDLIVLATGYKDQNDMVRRMFGEEIAGRVGRIWGYDPDLQELRNMWVRTGQPGLWFIAGSFAQCRIYSKFLGLQIKACEEKLIPLMRRAT